MLTRRTAIGAGLAAAALPAPLLAARATPSRFLWGAAMAAHQCEGNNANSDWWLLENLPGTIMRERSGDACDHYRLFDADIAMLAKLGLDTYRFSIEWARVEPEPGQFSAAAIAHYGEMLDACRRHGVTAVVTLHHFTSPVWFVLRGGFENPDAPRLFARYAARVAETLGDRIDWLCTINEANLTFGRLPAKLREAAARARGATTFTSFLFDDIAISKPIVRACHAAARTAFKAVRPQVPVGMTIAMSDIQGDTSPDNDGAAKKRSELYDAYLIAARDDDFVGVQTYTRERYTAAGRPVPPPTGSVRTQIGQEYYPAALEGTIRYAARTAKVPVLVTENGVGIADDGLRIRYIDGALAGMDRCIADGIDVRGYLHWSLLDNFEWVMGYGPKFGLVAVDRTTQKRVPKPSALHFGRIAAARRRARR